MKNKINVLLTFVLTLFIFINGVFAEEVSNDIDWTLDETLNLKEIDMRLLKSFERVKDGKDAVLQGMTMTDKYIIFSSITSEEDNTIINILDKNTLELLGTIDDYCFKHANDMTYNPNTDEIYILTSSKSIAKFKIVKNNNATDKVYELSNLEYVDVQRQYSGIAYDKDDDYYIGYSGRSAYIMNNKFEELYSISLPTNLTTQGISYFNNHIYFSCYEYGKSSKYQSKYNSKQAGSNLVYMYDLKGNLIKTLYIPNTLLKGEIEGTYFYNSRELLIGYNIRLNGVETVTFYKSKFPSLVKEISIQSNPLKISYVQDKEKLDLTGGSLSVIYNDESTAILDLTDEDIIITGFDNTKIGKNTLKIEYEGLTTTFDVEILEPIIEDEKIENPETGINFNYKIFIIIILLSSIIYLFVRKYSKFPKHN